MPSSPGASQSPSRQPLLERINDIDEVSGDVISRHVAPEIDETKKREIKENLSKYEQLFGADEDAFIQPTTTKKELWSYYLYYNVIHEQPHVKYDHRIAKSQCL